MNIFKKLLGKEDDTPKSIDEVRNILDRIDALRSLLSEQRMTEARFALDKVSRILDNPDIWLYSEQVQDINNTLSQIEQHVEKTYVNYIKEKCKKMEDIIMGVKVNSGRTALADKNEDKLSEMQADLTAINSKLKQTNAAMEAALDAENKNEWDRLKAKKTILSQKQKIKQQSYNSLLSHQTNLEVSSDLKEAKEEADYIEMQQNAVDLEAAKINAEASAYMAKEVQSVGSQLNDIINDNIGVSDDDCLYE